MILSLESPRTFRIFFNPRLQLFQGHIENSSHTFFPEYFLENGVFGSMSGGQDRRPTSWPFWRYSQSFQHERLKREVKCFPLRRFTQSANDVEDRDLRWILAVRCHH